MSKKVFLFVVAIFCIVVLVTLNIGNPQLHFVTPILAFIAGACCSAIWMELSGE